MREEQRGLPKIKIVFVGRRIAMVQREDVDTFLQSLAGPKEYFIKNENCDPNCCCYEMTEAGLTWLRLIWGENCITAE